MCRRWSRVEAYVHPPSSRQHRRIDVKQLQPGHRSKVTLTDDSKIGTFVDGRSVVKTSFTLDKARHEFILGRSEHIFRHTSKPRHTASLAFLGTCRSLRYQGQRPLPLRHDACPRKQTQHTKCLRGLINASYLVTDVFVNNIVEVASWSPKEIAKGQDASAPCLLEQDFDAHWPNAMDYVPNPAKEPVPRPASFCAPNRDRMSMFSGYIFVFSDAKQWENLSPVVIDGGGKCKQFKMNLGVTTLEEFVRFVKDIANEEGYGPLSDGGEGKGVVVVRFRGLDGTEQWALDFIARVDAALSMRSMEQNEFLDAVLLCDASSLRRPLLDEPDGIVAPPSTAGKPTPLLAKNAPAADDRAISSSYQVQNEPSSDNGPSQPAPTPAPAKRGLKRIIAQSRFKGFDDFDPSSLPKQTSYASASDDDSGEYAMLDTTSQANHDGLFVSQSQPTQPGQSRKRARPAEDEIMDQQQLMDEMLPAAAAMKRRRLAEEARLAENPPSPQEEAEVEEHREATPPTTKKVKNDPQVREAVKRFAQDMDKRNEDARRAPDDEIDQDDISQLRNLVIVEDMEVRASARAPRENGEGSANWDPRWNGRPNFKRFKKLRPGDKVRSQAQSNGRASRVIVGLEPVKPKDYGIGEAYWLEPAEEAQDRRRRERQGATPSQQLSEGNAIVLDEHGDEDEDDAEPEVAGSNQRSTRQQGGKKRASQSTQQSAPKRQATLRAAQARPQADESDDEDLSFRFRRQR
ncbi:hypothetical protein MRB53_037577 [Persea americana]|nr:hypothetical protein MRB53_037577 [Persea americana]